MISLAPIGHVSNKIQSIEFEGWSETVSEIILNEDIPHHAFNLLKQYEHLYIIFYLHRADKFNMIAYGKKSISAEESGIFAKFRAIHPNNLGLTKVKVLGISNNVLKVKGLDALNGTPVLDIKPIEN